jgi:uncharacterized glyoxalase superfamily protein PhnB
VERKEEAMAVKPIPDQYHSLQPYLLVEGAPRLVEFLKATFDAETSAACRHRRARSGTQRCASATRS